MADAPSTSSYLTASPEGSVLPNSQVLLADESKGLALTSTGPSGDYTLTTLGNLPKLYSYNFNGYMTYNPDTKTFVPRIFSPSSSIAITNADGKAGNTEFTVIPSSTIQLVQVSLNGSDRSTRSKLNFISGNHMSIGVTDNGGENNQTDIRLDVTGLTGGTVTSVGARSPEGTIQIGGSESPITSHGTFDFDLPDQEDVDPGTYYSPVIRASKQGIILGISEGEGPGSNTVTDIDWTMSPYEVQSDDQLLNVTEVNPEVLMEVVLPFSTRGRRITIKDTSDAIDSNTYIHVTVEAEEVPAFTITGPGTMSGPGILTAYEFELELEDDTILTFGSDTVMEGGVQTIGGLIDGQTSYDMELGYAAITVAGLTSTDNRWAII